MLSWKRHSRLAHAALAAAVIALCVAGATYASVARSHRVVQSSAAADLPKPINPNVPLTALDKMALASLHAQDPGITPGAVELLSTVNGSSFYDVQNSTGSDCFSVGVAGATDQVLGSIGCGTGFPSATTPVLDFTVMHGKPGTHSSRVWRSEGFAVAPVSTVAFQTPGGQLIDQTPVLNGIYSVAHAPAVEVMTLVGLTATGQVIWSKSIE